MKRVDPVSIGLVLSALLLIATGGFVILFPFAAASMSESDIGWRDVLAIDQARNLVILGFLAAVLGLAVLAKEARRR